MKPGDRILRITQSDWPEDFGERGKIYTVSKIVNLNHIKLEEISTSFAGASMDAFKIVTNLSQEEINALIAETALETVTIAKQMYDPFQHKMISVPSSPNVHTHTWSLYTGLVEQFEHCTGCGERRK